jgi:hypothetical protein
MRDFLKNNSLSLVMFALFFLFWVGNALTGQRHYNEEQREHQQSEVSFGEYLRSGDFWESTTENWESEFLQMAAFVWLSAFLIQKGSPESKKPEADEADEEPEVKPSSPWPVHQGGLVLTLYERSLSLALFSIFLVSFFLHAIFGERAYNEEQLQHGGHLITIFQYAGSSQFWFESFQNWQSEFMSVGVLVVLSIFLRQKGSPESKPMGASYAKTGH